MNDSELEDQLRGWRPAAPARILGQRIAQDLSAPVAHARSGQVMRPAENAGPAWRWLRDLGWAVAGAAAALTISALFSAADRPAVSLAATAPLEAPLDVTATAVAPDAAFEPVGSTSELLGSEDSAALVETTDGLAREVRYSFRERHAWTNPQTGARMEVVVPREDVYLVPVSLQ